MIAVFDRTSPLGTNLQRGTSSARNALKFTLFTDATIEAYSISLQQYSTVGQARVALCEHDAGTDLPGSIIAGSTVLKNASELTGSAALYQLTLAAPLSLPAGVYWLIMDDNGNGSAYVNSGLNTGATDGFRKLYNGNVTTNYTWTWALWADDTYVPLGHERYYVDPSATSSTELGTNAQPFKSLQTAITQTCNKTFAEPIQIRCRTSGGVADTARVTDASLGQMVTSSSNYLEIVAEDGHRAGTSWDAAKYHLFPAYSVQAGAALGLAHAHVRVDGLQIGISSLTGGAEIVYWSQGSTGRLSNCYIRGASSDAYFQRGISIINGLEMWNCVIVLPTTSAHASSACVQNHQDSKFYSCTFIGGANTVNIPDGTCVAKNCYAGGGTVGYQGTLTKTTCASSDASGSAGLQNIPVDDTTFVSVTPGAEDFALAPGSPLIDAGTDTSGDGTVAGAGAATDINGTARG